MPKTEEEIQEFMDRQRLASFATVDPATRPLAAPVFHLSRQQCMCADRPTFGESPAPR